MKLMLYALIALCLGVVSWMSPPEPVSSSNGQTLAAALPEAAGVGVETR